MQVLALYSAQLQLSARTVNSNKPMNPPQRSPAIVSTDCIQIKCKFNPCTRPNCRFLHAAPAEAQRRPQKEQPLSPEKAHERALVNAANMARALADAEATGTSEHDLTEYRRLLGWSNRHLKECEERLLLSAAYVEDAES